MDGYALSRKKFPGEREIFFLTRPIPYDSVATMRQKKKYCVRLRGQLVKQGITQDRLAEELGLSKSAISKRMHHHIPWSAGERTAVARVLGLAETTIF